jgi:hypothetical protein
MLTLPPVPDLERLTVCVGPALADYRIWKEHMTLSTVFQEPVPVIRGAFQRWVIPGGDILATHGLTESLIHGGRWFLQIHVREQPRYYARVRHVRGQWATEWFGEAWLARDVHMAIEFLEERGAGLEGELRLVSSRLYEFTSLWLYPRNVHLVASASDRLARLPRRQFIEAERLQQALLAEFGGNYAAGALV